MSRRELREQIFKFIFRVEFNDREEMPEQEQFFFENLEAEAQENELPRISETDAAYISDKGNRILEKLDEIDTMINTRAKGWTTQRMGKVDLTILRLAVYEIIFDKDVPTSVAINEAVELAKRFGQDESSGFVNGVLAKFAVKK
ncbi:MAG: transcription antitermination factor NusB [Lachnospiraceae bacterium]|nr:transcription antitermination factor NusB [Lachnospiraceae bacterium]HBV81421.1 transcription antitermination factor NusB [Lachnospiraceae bacterium]